MILLDLGEIPSYKSSQNFHCECIIMIIMVVSPVCLGLNVQLLPGLEPDETTTTFYMMKMMA